MAKRDILALSAYGQPTATAQKLDAEINCLSMYGVRTTLDLQLRECHKLSNDNIQQNDKLLVCAWIMNTRNNTVQFYRWQ